MSSGSFFSASSGLLRAVPGSSGAAAAAVRRAALAPAGAGSSFSLLFSGSVGAPAVLFAAVRVTGVVVWSVPAFGSAPAGRCVVSVSSGFVVGFGGSRGLPSVAAPGGLVWSVLSSVLAAGGSVRVGCCVGADAAVLSSVSGVGFSPSSVSVFAAFGRSGSGAWSGSARSLVLSAAGAGVSVAWWAGGGSSVPLGGRLAGRTRALVGSLPVGSSAFVAFFGPGRSVGTVGACRSAVSRGVPVWAFCVGRSAPPPLGRASGGLGVPGRWVPSGVSSGVWARAWRWVPA